ncbi:thioredoxin family protein [Thalassotalea sp. SU-HH00458]|uniref:thioredoxin family protein n=1 Tax=Thalassotalea sp. SU-HH00458 TaxID=3127657 RepID=UPI003108F472
MNKVITKLILAASFSFLLGCVHTTEHDALTVGKIDAQALLSNYQSFHTPHRQFSLSDRQIALVKQWPRSVHIEVYFGTWCHDSQREVPKLLKILSHNQTVTYNLIALDYQKTEPTGVAIKDDIKFTPTFIVFQNKKELGRIIERPKTTLLNDLDEIIQLKGKL